MMNHQRLIRMTRKAALFVLVPLIAASLIGVALAQTASLPTAQMACTMEARQCPDGSWVGRTGPNCEFSQCPSSSSPCRAIERNLSRGVIHSAVSSLQDFLASQGYFSGASIGIFGPATQRAVIAFQRDNGLPATGYVGALTRAALAKRCGTPPIANAVRIYSMTPRSGPVGTLVTIDGTGFTNDNTIHFGSGVVPHVAMSGQNIGGVQKLTFIVPDALTPACYYMSPRCLMPSRETSPGNYDVSVENTNGTSNGVTFTVTGGTTQTPRIDSEVPTQGPVGTSVTLIGQGFESAGVLRFAEGSIPFTTSAGGTRINFTVPESVGPYCAPTMYCAMYMRLVTPGTYDVYLQNTDGTLVSNKVQFTVTPASSSGTLSINGIDSPATLPMGVSGTWTVRVTANSAYPNLRYSVVWGDEIMNFQSGMVIPPATTVQNTASFTHAYQRTGSYNPTFTVSDDSGRSVTVSTSVVVTPWY